MTDPMRPYYQCFCQWLSFTHGVVRLRFQMGLMSADEIRPYVREWAEDIVVTKPKKGTDADS